MATLFKSPGVLLLLAFVVAGLVLVIWEPVPPAQLLAWGERLAGNPVALVGVILLQAVLLTFALPGSVVLWMVAPFHAPWFATLILLIGSLSGAIGARYFSMRLRDQPEQPEQSHAIVGLLRHRADFSTQCALRALPGFPHSLINYAGGILHLPLPTFLLAAGVGLGIKWGVYATAIHGAAEAAEGRTALDVTTLGALVLLAIMMFTGAWLRRRIERQNRSRSDQSR